METVKVQNLSLSLHRRTAKLLFLSKKKPQDINIGRGVSIKVNIITGEVEIEDLQSDDPSTIFSVLPVKQPTNVASISRPDYYPSYARLTPEQRWVYLQWLQNIAQPTDIGYVFLYYYGLERHLLFGEFDLAVDEILYLREHHENNSFSSYSNCALLHSCINKNRADRLKEVFEKLGSGNLSNTHLLIAFKLGFDLNAQILIKVSRGIQGINRRYIEKHPDIFQSVLEEKLRGNYRSNYFPFSTRYKLEDLPIRGDLSFANISFPEQLRSPKLPNFFEYEPFISEVRLLFEKTHQEVKEIVKKNRNQPKKRIEQT